MQGVPLVCGEKHQELWQQNCTEPELDSTQNKPGVQSKGRGTTGGIKVSSVGEPVTKVLL